MEAIKFSHPSNVEGVGYLIVYGGVPQFSIAWNATLEPQRILPQDVAVLGININGKKADLYEVQAADGGYTLTEKVSEPVVPVEETNE